MNQCLLYSMERWIIMELLSNPCIHQSWVTYPACNKSILRKVLTYRLTKKSSKLNLHNYFYDAGNCEHLFAVYFSFLSIFQMWGPSVWVITEGPQQDFNAAQTPCGWQIHTMIPYLDIFLMRPPSREQEKLGTHELICNLFSFNFNVNQANSPTGRQSVCFQRCVRLVPCFSWFSVK